MTQYGKLVGDDVEFAPTDRITVENTTYKPPTEEILKQAGYKPIIYTPYPENGNEYKAVWKQTKYNIKQAWELVRELTPSERRSLAYEEEACCLFNKEYYTCDELEKMYYQYFAEDGKEDICAEIKTAITEGKAHIRKEYPDSPETVRDESASNRSESEV